MALNVGETSVIQAVEGRLRDIASGMSGNRARVLLNQAEALAKLREGEPPKSIEVNVPPS